MATSNHIRVRFSVVMLCGLVVLLSASPCRALTFVFGGQTLDISGPSDYVVVYGGTVNLRPGADVGWLDVYEGTLNLYGGNVRNPILILSDPDPLVTIYGAGFALDGSPLVDENGQPLSEFIPAAYAPHTLTGTYESGGQVDLKFWVWGDVPIHLAVSAPPEVAIDIKPGSDTNPINLKSNGLIPVAVLTTDSFDAGAVDPQTARLAGVASLRWTMEDVDGDGDKDMLFHFKTQDLATVLTEDSTEATLEARLAVSVTSLSAGQTTNGPTVSGTDKVQIISSKK